MGIFGARHMIGEEFAEERGGEMGCGFEVRKPRGEESFGAVATESLLPIGHSAAFVFASFSAK